MEGSSAAVSGMRPPRFKRNRGRRFVGCTVAVFAAVLCASLFTAPARGDDPPSPVSDGSAITTDSTPSDAAATASSDGIAPTETSDTSAATTDSSGTAGTTDTRAPAPDATDTSAATADGSAAAANTAGAGTPASDVIDTQSPLEVELPANRADRPSFLPALRLASQPCAPDVKCDTRSSDKGRSHGEEALMEGSSAAVSGMRPPRFERNRGRGFVGCTVAVFAAVLCASLFTAPARGDDPPSPVSDGSAMTTDSTPSDAAATASSDGIAPTETSDTSAATTDSSGTADATDTRAPAPDATDTSATTADGSAAAANTAGAGTPAPDAIDTFGHDNTKPN